MNTDHWPSVREAAAQVQAGEVLADGFERLALQRIADALLLRVASALEQNLNEIPG